MRTTVNGVLEQTKSAIEDYDHVVLHMPNAKFPNNIDREFNITPEQLEHGFIVPEIGNTYSACSPLGLAHVLQHAKKNHRILLCSYGSGAGCDAFTMTMLRDGIVLPPDQREIEMLTYAEYAKRRH